MLKAVKTDTTGASSRYTLWKRSQKCMGHKKVFHFHLHLILWRISLLLSIHLHACRSSCKPFVTFFGLAKTGGLQTLKMFHNVRFHKTCTAVLEYLDVKKKQKTDTRKPLHAFYKLSVPKRWKELQSCDTLGNRYSMPENILTLGNLPELEVSRSWPWHKLQVSVVLNLKLSRVTYLTNTALIFDVQVTVHRDKLL